MIKNNIFVKHNFQRCDLSCPVVPAWVSMLVIVTVAFELGLTFYHRLKIIDLEQLSVYCSLWNYLLFVGICLLYSKRLKYLVKDKYFILILLFLLNCAFVDFVSATILYHQPLVGILRTTFRYGGLLVYPLLFITVDKHRFQYVIKTMIIIGFIGAILAILLIIWPSFAESLIVKERISERFGWTRLPILFACAVYFMFFLSYVQIIKYNKYNWAWIWFLSFFVIYYINMTRQIMLSFLGAMLLFAMFHLKIRRLFKVFAFFLVITTVVLLISSEVFSVFSESINSIIDASAKDYGNVSVRKEAIEFYWDQFQQTDYVGFGRISTTHGGQNPIEGEFDAEAGGRLFISDIGLIGSFFQYGFGLLLIVIVAYIYAFADIRRVINRVNQSDYAIITAIELLLVAEIIRLGPFFTFEDSAFFFSLYFFIISFINDKHRLKKAQ